MTRQETVSILAILRAAFPSFYKGMERKELEGIVSLWNDMFQDDAANVVAGAVKALIVTKTTGYPPTIGEVKEHVRRITQPREMTEQEAWAHISKALRNSLYGSEEEFLKLPPVLQSVVHDPRQLREWAMMDEATVQSVVASNVQRSFRARAQQARDFEALPEDVKALSRGLAEQLSLQEETQKNKSLKQEDIT